LPEPEDATEGGEPLDPVPTSKIADALSTQPSSAAKAQAAIRQLLRAIDPNDPEHLHQLLDIILALRGIARGNSDGEEAALGREVAALLICGAMDWMRSGRPYFAGSVEKLETEPDRWRFELRYRLGERCDLLPEWMRELLSDALITLNDGSELTPGVFAPTPKRGRGFSPGYARFLERKMVCWTFYEAGRGATMEQATKILAGKLGRSVKSVEVWRTDWAKENAEELAAEEATYRARGAAEQSFRVDGGTIDEAVRDWKRARLPEKAKAGERS
jgi:hypothetical protein